MLILIGRNEMKSQKKKSKWFEKFVKSGRGMLKRAPKILVVGNMPKKK